MSWVSSLGHAIGSVARGATKAIASVGIPVVSDIAGAVDNLITEGHQERRQDKLRAEDQAYQTAEREAAQDWSKMMWDEQNNYNLPVNQLARMKAAGINPNDAAQSVAGASQAVGAPSSQGMSAPSPMTVTTDEINSALEAGQTITDMQLARQKQKESETAASLNRASEKQIGHQIDKLLADTDLTKEQASQVRQLTPLLVGKTSAEIQSIYYQAQLLVQQIQTEETKRKDLEADIKLKSANERLANAQTDLANQQVHESEARTEGLRYDNAVKELVANLASQGIYVSNTDMGTLVALLMSGRADNIVGKLFDNVRKMLFGSDEPEPPEADKITEAVGDDGKVDVNYQIAGLQRVTPEEARRAKAWNRASRGLVHNMLVPRKKSH